MERMCKSYLWVFLILVLIPHKVLLLEYGEECDLNVECTSADYRDPLECISSPPETTPTITPTTSPTTTPTTSPTTTPTTSPTTTPTTSPTTTPTTSPTSTSETTQEPTTEELEPTTTQESTTEELEPTTTQEPTTEELEPTTTQEPTTEELEPTTTQEPTITPGNETFDTQDSDQYDSAWSEQSQESLWSDFDFGPYNLKTFAIGKCGCSKGMFRSKDLNRCVSSHEGACDLKVYEGNPMETCTKFAECFPTSINSTKGKCYCDLDTIVDSNTGLCRLSYGSSRCEKPEDCDVLNHLTCKNSTCTCKYEQFQRWNAKEQKCGFLIEESCNATAQFSTPVCVENASCLEDEKICKCDSGFIETPERDCKQPYNGTCSVDSDCHSFFQCLDSVCGCPEGQRYSNSTGRCHLVEESSCNPSQDACMPHSQCLNGMCVCDVGYNASSDHSCRGLYGSKCSPNDSPCHQDWYLGECNSTIGVCQCQENYNYHAGAKRCVGNVDEACGVDEDCTDHAICQLSKCTCGGTYIPGSGEDKKSCYAKYGESCGIIQCYPQHFLKCDEDKVCNCKNLVDQTFDKSLGYCVALADRYCGTNGDGIECVAFSKCGVQEDSTKCTCWAGYSANSTGFCQPNQESTSTKTMISGGFYMIMVWGLLISKSF